MVASGCSRECAGKGPHLGHEDGLEHGAAEALILAVCFVLGFFLLLFLVLLVRRRSQQLLLLLLL
jgi:hypothetical protein